MPIFGCGSFFIAEIEYGEEVFTPGIQGAFLDGFWRAHTYLLHAGENAEADLFIC